MSEEQDLDEVQSKHCSYEKDGVWYIGESTACLLYTSPSPRD